LTCFVKAIQNAVLTLVDLDCMLDVGSVALISP
jgi:hypothetical protein